MSIRLESQQTEQEKRILIYNELKKQIENIEKIQDEVRNNKIEDSKNSDNYREPLSIEKEICIKILLSWGGGEDGFKLYFTDEKELLRGVYYCADWGEYQEIPLNEDELNLIFDFYLYSEYPEN